MRADLISDETCPGNRYGLVREAVVQVNKNFKNHRVGNHYLNEINEKLENTVVDKLSSVEGWAVSGFSVEEQLLHEEEASFRPAGQPCRLSN